MTKRQPHPLTGSSFPGAPPGNQPWTRRYEEGEHGVYTQDFDPVSSSLGLSSIFPVLPVLALFVLLGGLRWPRSGPRSSRSGSRCSSR